MGINEIVNQANVDGWIARHRAHYLEDGAAAHLWDSAEVGGPGPVPTLLLTTVGRRSGNTSIMPLIYGEFDGTFVVIASKGGTDHHPGWFHNLLEQETVGVQVADRVFEATARVATGEERAQIWSRMRTIYPPYDDYQKRTTREIPVVVLTPVP
jgi:deazaflavin-dependent oxidoreductase (nitroreductase family)